MKKFRRQLWAKCTAMILAVVSGLAAVFFAVAALFAGIVPDLQGNQRDYEKAFYEPILSTYAAVLWDQVTFSESGDVDGGLDALDGGNIHYKVQMQKCDYYGNLDEENYRDLYTNDESLAADNCVLTKQFEQGDYTRYNASTFTWAMRGARSWGNGEYWWNSGNGAIDALCYNEADGLFYFRIGSSYYIVPEFTFAQYDSADWENQTDGGVYTIRSKDKALEYCADTDDKPLGAAQVQEWMDSDRCALLFSGITAVFHEPQEDTVQVELLSETIPEDQRYGILSYSGNADYMEWNYATVAERTVYRVLLAADDEPEADLILNSGHTDYLAEARKLADSCYTFGRYSGWYLAASLLLFLFCFVFLMSAAGWRRDDDEIHLRWIDRVPFGVYTGLLLWIEALGIYLVWEFAGSALRYNEISLGLIVSGCVVPLASLLLLGLLYCMSIAVRLKAKKFCRYTLCYYVWKPFAWGWRAIRENTAMYVKAGVWFAVVFVFELAVLSSLSYAGDVISFFILLKLAEIVAGIWLLWQMNRIWEGGRRIAAGDYSKPIATKGMLWDIKKHAENLNSVSEGISLAVEERMKSERFKTELITNVSHDIKTPLTSIINYVDLIKKEDVTDPTLAEYVAVLERQSLRLKKLIEDLMEASKASTGNLSVDFEVCDATVMLSQVVGEFQGRAEENSLELIVTSPEPPVQILADGRHLWRVLDNLMSNVCKYAMPGTRVYIDLEVFHGMVIMTFRNISRTQLNISSEELMERFVRGDSSRNTEGSGLGLNIAQSLTALMNGNMAIQIDGDLFKAIVSFAQLSDS